MQMSLTLSKSSIASQGEGRGVGARHQCEGKMEGRWAPASKSKASRPSRHHCRVQPPAVDCGCEQLEEEENKERGTNGLVDA